jgi:hypothetical protein
MIQMLTVSSFKGIAADKETGGYIFYLVNDAILQEIFKP